MKVPAYVALLAVVIGTVCAQDENLLRVKLTPNKTKSVQIGGDLNVACDVNRPLSQLTHSFHVDFVMKSLDEEVILFKAPNEIVLTAAHFNVSLDQVYGNGIQLNLTTRNVTDHFDGRLICRVNTTPENVGQIKEDHLDIEILRPLDTFRLYLDDAGPITESTTDPVELDSGNHTVACVAEGSNPAPSVTLYLDDEEVPDVETKSDKMELKVTKFRTTVTASLNISSSDQQLLHCAAKSQFGDNPSIRFPIKIKQYDPEIICNGLEACEGQRNITISCTVDYTDLDITSFNYSLGSKEYNSEGDYNDEFVQVSKEQLSDTKVRVHLKLTKVEDWHFQTEFYMLVGHRDSRVSRRSVRLREIKDKCNCASFGASQITILWLCCLVAFISLTGQANRIKCAQSSDFKLK
jgi:hypothetical protein